MQSFQCYGSNTNKPILDCTFGDQSQNDVKNQKVEDNKTTVSKSHLPYHGNFIKIIKKHACPYLLRDYNNKVPTFITTELCFTQYTYLTPE